MVKINGAFPYIGGKFQVIAQLWNYLPKEAPRTYVEPFVGSGVMLNNLAYNKTNWCNTKYIIGDINKQVFEMWDLIIKQELHKSFMEKYKDDKCQWGVVTNSKCDRVFHELYNQYKDNIDEIPPRDHFFRISLTYKALIKNLWIITQPKSTLSYKLHNYARKLYNTEQILKNKDVKVFRQDYSELVKTYDSPETFFYFDPPYYEKIQIKRAGMIKKNGGRQTLKSISSTIYDNGGDFDWTKFIDTLKNIRGKWMLSINKNAYILEQFKDYNIFYIKVKRPMKANKIEYELLITNYNQKQYIQTSIFNLGEQFQNEWS